MAEYITKDKAKEIFCEFCQWGGTSKCEECEHPVGGVPAADVAPVKHGKWIETTQPMGWSDVTCAECSECGEDFVLDEWGMEDMKNLMLYCPNCGARMDGGDGNGKD